MSLYDLPGAEIILPGLSDLRNGESNTIGALLVAIAEGEKEHEFNKIYNYMDFCNEQIFLRKNGRVRENTWMDWQNGMKINFSLPIFDETSKKVFEKLPDIFHELRMVKDKNFDTDPKKW